MTPEVKQQFLESVGTMVKDGVSYRVWDSISTSVDYTMNTVLKEQREKMADKVFRSIQTVKTASRYDRWNAHYAEKLKDPSRYVDHLLKTYAPFFTLPYRYMGFMEEHMTRVGQVTGRSVYCNVKYLVELGASPGFVYRAFVRQRNTMRQDYDGRLHLASGFGSPNMVNLNENSAEGFSAFGVAGTLMSNAVSITAEMKKDLAIDDLTSASYRRAVQATADNYFGRNDVVYCTFGVLEHLQDQEIRDILEWCGKTPSVHYVPLVGHGEPSVGDERLLDLSYWLILANPSYWEVFNDGKDLVFLIDGEMNSLMSHGARGWEVEEHG